MRRAAGIWGQQCAAFVCVCRGWRPRSRVPDDDGDGEEKLRRGGFRMGIAPTKPAERAAFYQEKSASPDGPWVLQATNIGTTTSAVADLNTKAQTALNKWQVALAAREAAKTATQDFYQAIAAMS